MAVRWWRWRWHLIDIDNARLYSSRTDRAFVVAFMLIMLASVLATAMQVGTLRYLPTVLVRVDTSVATAT